MLAEQISLLGRTEPRCDPGFAGLRRIDLGEGAWIEHLPGWLEGHETVFEALRKTMAWEEHRRVMYDKLLDVPRRTASWPDGGPGHPVIERIAAALGARYGAPLARAGLCYYRDGVDSVAWHADREFLDVAEAIVAIVSVGEPRRFLLRPAAGGAARTFSLGWGDLLVMGGACQRLWHHCVPKARAAGPRISLVFRHAYG